MIVLYSTGCPKCKVLKKKLDDKCIEYEVVEGAEPILDLGYTEAPLLCIDDKIYEFNSACTIINQMEA